MAIKRITQRVNDATNQSNLITTAFMKALDLDKTVNANMSVNEVAEKIGDALITSGEVVVDSELSDTSTHPVQNKVVTGALNGKQATLVSGTNIKSINNTSLLGEGDITISGGLTEVTASDVDSESATSGQVLTADGSGNASWQTPSAGGIEPINLKDTTLFGTLPTFYISGTNANDGDVDFTGFTENGYNALKNGQIAYLKDTTANYDLTFVKDRVFNRVGSDYIVYVAKNFYYPMIKNTFNTGPIDISYVLIAKYDGSSYTCKMSTCTNTLYLGSVIIPQGTGAERLERSVYENTLMYNPNLKVAFNYTYTYGGTSHNIDCILDRIFVDRQNKVAYFYLPSYYNLSRNDPTGIVPGELIVSINFKTGTYCDIRFNLPNTNSSLANNIIPTSTEPSSTNTYYTANGAYRPYICTESNEPATKYNGYIYFITED